MYSDKVIQNQLDNVKGKIQLEIQDLEQKADLARRRGDWTLVEFHRESISKLKRSLALQPRIEEIKRKMAEGTLKPSDLRRRHNAS